jgi:hypothetical protein
MQDFTRDSVIFDLSSAILYVGFYKPINKIYIDLTSPNSLSSTLTIQYWNGSAFVDLDDVLDETKTYSRNGFIQWSREQTNQVANTVDGKELFWYKLTNSSVATTMDINGLNLLFADDKDLAERIPEINDDAHLTGKSSHVLAHVSAKKNIIQELRNKNYGKRDVDGVLQDITIWDLLDIDQINAAATLKALSIIYFNFSDEPNDSYERKSKSFESGYKEAMKLAVLNLDLDDDGLKDITENHTEFKGHRVTR